MADACPVMTPEERRNSEIVADVEAALLDKVLAALTEAEATASAALSAGGMDPAPSLRPYFTADLHQKLYCILCGADPDTFVGGNPKTAEAIIRNGQNIAKHYWGAAIDPLPPD